MKPTPLDFNKLESQVIRGDYQGLKAQGVNQPTTERISQRST